jgi:hypothetical protein
MFEPAYLILDLLGEILDVCGQPFVHLAGLPALQRKFGSNVEHSVF